MKWGFRSIRAMVAVLGVAALVVFFVTRPFFGEGKGLQADAADLAKTTISCHLDVPIKDGRNLVWCGTFQLAWNEVCSLVGEDLHFQGSEPAAVSSLNRKAFAKDDLDGASYVALADFVKNDVFAQIQRQVEARFHGDFTPRCLPPASLTPRPQDIVAYSCLLKDLEFEKPFERIEEPLSFRGTAVPCFGIDEEYKNAQAGLFQQVLIDDYQSENDFVIELASKSEDDRLVLAKVAPGETLADTIEAVERRLADCEPQQAGACDVLKAPKFDFDLSRHFTELEGLNPAVQNPAVAKDLTILSAMQNIRFEMNEKGARLRSDSHISFGCGMEPRPEFPHIMVFDKPFLVLLQRRDRDMPYFAMWVDNAELLVK